MVTRILIFGSDTDFLPTIEPLLRARSYDVVSALTAQELVDTVENQVVDVIIGDFSAEAVDHLSACCQIRHSLGIPVLVVSSHPSEDNKVRVLEAGLDDCVARPFGEEELLARIRALLRRVHRH